ncbi:MAG: hypothetical protein QOE05_3802 [Actinomycetota bacterium]|nr:hypothetical protein [Actinomycetota bacterium]
MPRVRLLALPALLLLATPLLAPSSGAAVPAPTYREYPSPIGADVTVGLPIPPELGSQPFVPDEQHGLADRAGEPTIGINPKTGNVMFFAKQQTLRVNGFDSKGPGSSVWADATDRVEGIQTSDPILHTDTDTGRTFINQLLVTGCSLQAFTDDDGKTYTRSAQGCGPGIAFDHQTLVTGKRTEGSAMPPTIGYPNYLYYCTNDVAQAACATSIDGGLTFLPAIPVYTIADSDCSGIFGHIKTSPKDGTLYLMPDGCGKTQGVWRSDDNAVTWTFHPIPGSTVGAGGHPSISVGRDGTLYAAWSSALSTSSEGPLQVAVSTTRGDTWSKPVALGTDKGVLYTSFPLVAAGDGDRAAAAYLGATEEGNPRNEAQYKGVWRLYVSTTYDRGRTWQTVVATPKSPIQVGSICTGGLSCGTDRNLLDFNDMDIDLRTGYPVIGLADGCLKVTGCTKLDRLDKGLIVRQVSGQSLLRSAATVPAPAAPAAPKPPATAPKPSAPATGNLPATGLGATLPGVGALLLLGTAWAARRRVTR